ncbi:hypothetical protein ACNKHO_10990 [Shigella flexneri]
MEYAWFNNVETKPAIGFPKTGKMRMSGKAAGYAASPGMLPRAWAAKWAAWGRSLPTPYSGIDDYYEPFTFDYQDLHRAPEGNHLPTARPRSLIDGKRMNKIVWGPNWEELPGGEFEKRARDRNFDEIQKEMYGQFENTFMMYLPRLCEHCLNPSCVATCPAAPSTSAKRMASC